jgi:hypothetical protein
VVFFKRFVKPGAGFFFMSIGPLEIILDVEIL